MGREGSAEEEAVAEGAVKGVGRDGSAAEGEEDLEAVANKEAKEEAGGDAVGVLHWLGPAGSLLFEEAAEAEGAL